MCLHVMQGHMLTKSIWFIQEALPKGLVHYVRVTIHALHYLIQINISMIGIDYLTCLDTIRYPRGLLNQLSQSFYKWQTKHTKKKKGVNLHYMVTLTIHTLHDCCECIKISCKFYYIQHHMNEMQLQKMKGKWYAMSLNNKSEFRTKVGLL